MLELELQGKVMSSYTHSAYAAAPVVGHKQRDSSSEDEERSLCSEARLGSRFHWPHNLVKASRKLRMECSPTRDTTWRGIPPRRIESSKDFVPPEAVAAHVGTHRNAEASPVRGRLRWRRELREARDRLIQEVFHGIKADDE